jgi:hypothetical protein
MARPTNVPLLIIKKIFIVAEPGSVGSGLMVGSGRLGQDSDLGFNTEKFMQFSKNRSYKNAGIEESLVAVL